MTDRTYIAIDLKSFYVSVERQLGESNYTLEWNLGRHFVDCERRLARAFLWNLQKLAENAPALVQ